MDPDEDALGRIDILFPFPDMLHKGVRVFAGLDQFLSGVLFIF
jgi:hypothetical protein